MKKFLTVSCLLAGSLAFGGIDDTVVTFSTKGPDKYADDVTVLDGEYYALVWVKKGATFAGVTTDGKAVDETNNKILLKAPVAKGGKCPNIQYTIDEAYYSKNNLASGELFVYLLDTRKFQVDANGEIVKDADGKPVAVSCGQGSALVNGYGDTGAVVSGKQTSADVAGAVAAGAKAAIPAIGKNLRIRDIKLIDGNVYLYVRGSLPSVRYGLKFGNKPNALKKGTKEKYGRGIDEDLIIVTPQTDGAQFFGVEAN